MADKDERNEHERAEKEAAKRNQATGHAEVDQHDAPAFTPEQLVTPPACPPVIDWPDAGAGAARRAPPTPTPTPHR